MLVIGRKHHLLSPERHLLFPEQGLFGVQRYCWTIRTETSPSQGDSCVAGIIPYATTEMEEACRWSRLTSPAVRHPIQLICSGLIGASFASAHCLAVFFLSASSLFTVPYGHRNSHSPIRSTQSNLSYSLIFCLCKIRWNIPDSGTASIDKTSNQATVFQRIVILQGGQINIQKEIWPHQRHLFPCHSKTVTKSDRAWNMNKKADLIWGQPLSYYILRRGRLQNLRFQKIS